MTEWYRASEIAGFAGMPTSEQNIRLRAGREGWRSRPRRGHGGGREYHVSSLPKETRAELALHRVKTSHSDAPAAVPRPYKDRADRLAFVAKPQRSQLQADAKTQIVLAWQAFRKAGGLGLVESRELFARAYNIGDVAVEAWVRDAVSKTSKPSLVRWARQLRSEGVARLCGRDGNRRGSGLLDRDPELHDFVVGMLTAKPHVSATHVMRGLRARFEGRALPSYRSAQRWIARWKLENAAALLAISNPDAHKSRHLPAFGAADESVERLNQLWELDSTPADVMLKDGRHAVIGVVDVYSRRGRILVTRTSRATAICSLMRVVILTWGVPERVKTDRGQDYTSRHLTRALADLGIGHDLCRPYTPEGKPFIERFLGTLSRDLFELLPGYIGHDVAERRAIESRKSFAARRGLDDAVLFEAELTAEELQARCDAWCEDQYGREPHEGLGGKSPYLAAAAWPGPVARVGDERALDLLLAEAPGDGTRRVGKKGIRVDGLIYIHGELGALVGERVLVRYDPEDVGRVYVFDTGSGDFICAAEAPEVTGISRREVAIEARRRRAQVDKAIRAEARRLKAAVKPHEIADEIAAQAAAEAGRVVAFPQHGEEIETPALQEAAAATRGRRPPERDSYDDLSPEEKARIDREVAEDNRRYDELVANGGLRKPGVFR